MREEQQRVLTVVTGCVLGALMVMAGGVFTERLGHGRTASGRDEAPDRRRFVVQGSGLYRVKPDILRARFRASAEGETATGAQTHLVEQMTALLGALTRLGVKEADLATGQRELVAVTVATGPRGLKQYRGDQVRAFRASETLTATIRDVDHAGRYLDEAIAAGAEVVGEASFTIEQLGPARNHARELAARNARQRAETIAGAAGARLGRVMRLSETPLEPYYGFRPAGDPRNAVAQAVESRPVGASDVAGPEDGMEPGLLDVPATVYVEYELVG